VGNSLHGDGIGYLMLFESKVKIENLTSYSNSAARNDRFQFAAHVWLPL
jgi:hypothetical protein